MTTAEAITFRREDFRNGTISRDQVLHSFQAAPVEDLGLVPRSTSSGPMRKGFPEVIYGGKQNARAGGQDCNPDLRARAALMLVTRVTPDHVRALKKKFKHAIHHETARCATVEKQPLRKRPGKIPQSSALSTAADLPVAEEAAVTAEIMGNEVDRIYDVGVAGLHRLLSRLGDLQSAKVIVAVAGMEGALPSVVVSLVSRPVIAVPTSVGYGTSFGGIAELAHDVEQLQQRRHGGEHRDNGFGAGYAASQINELAA